MSFNWLDDFHRRMEKPPNYAEKTLAAYALGIKAKGSLIGVRVETAGESCQMARTLPPDTFYQPEDAPRLPLPDCPLGRRCPCVYRPVMKYERDET